MTQELINKHIERICYYMNAATLDRIVDNPQVIDFFLSVAWALDVLGGPQNGLSFIPLSNPDYEEVKNWVLSNHAFVRDIHRNYLLINLEGYSFCVVREKQNL